VFTNAALHWMPDHRRVVDDVSRALKPGGRFVGECGGHGNVATIVAALEAGLAARGLAARNPWVFPRPGEFRTLLESRGFEVATLDLIPRPTRLPGDVRGWLETFAQPFTSVLSGPDRAAFVAELVDALRARLCHPDGQWHADYVRLRFAARKPRD
jgi:trans-aconitate methyltransferase